MISEVYEQTGPYVSRHLQCGDFIATTRLRNLDSYDIVEPAWKKWWQSYLKGSKVECLQEPTRSLRIIDLFCGCGGFSLGAIEAIRGVGVEAKVLAAVDVDSNVLDIYSKNISPHFGLLKNINGMVDFKIQEEGEKADFAFTPEILDDDISRYRNRVDLMIAGPPCQGHSNLNNHTRRADPRNILYYGAVAVAIALNARSVIIENVPDILNDRKGIVETSKALFRKAGYTVTDDVLNATDHGCAQARRRHFLVASRNLPLTLGDVVDKIKKDSVDLAWGIGDLLHRKCDSVFDTPPKLTNENQRRIDYLFDNEIHDLPNSERPDCHKNGHTYPSVYGRMKWDQPAQTITTGFMTPGRGRYIHPRKSRVLTPHEGARLQGFPDSFLFHLNGEGGWPPRNVLAKSIGEAVPIPLGYVATLCALAGLSID